VPAFKPLPQLFFCDPLGALGRIVGLLCVYGGFKSSFIGDNGKHLFYINDLSRLFSAAPMGKG
jgi:hypothetical protein